MKKGIKIKFTHLVLAMLAIVFVLANYTVNAQDVPAEVKEIVGMKLENGQAKLQEMGYEICFSSLFGKKQDWINEDAQICVTIKFSKSEEITDVSINPETSECLTKLENARKIWENYHDGQAPVSDAKIDEERKKLTDTGFKVSYWVNDVSPGRAAEYWVNESTQKVKSIVWDIQGSKWAMTHDSDYSMGKNPAPAK
jgi:predicted Rdx family selenoprotein